MRHCSDDNINCDICNVFSGRTDNRDPWLVGRSEAVPTWRCDTCKKAVKDATEQRLGSLHPTVSFPTKEAAEAYERDLKGIGFHTLSTTPLVSTNEVKRRRFKIKE